MTSPNKSLLFTVTLILLFISDGIAANDTSPRPYKDETGKIHINKGTKTKKINEIIPGSDENNFHIKFTTIPQRPMIEKAKNLSSIEIKNMGFHASGWIFRGSVITYKKNIEATGEYFLICISAAKSAKNKYIVASECADFYPSEVNNFNAKLNAIILTNQ